jgi:hypothetical protein
MPITSMYEKHPVFTAPTDENIKIWRYMDFTKFLSFIDKKTLFFTRVDQLEDKFEGRFTKYLFNPEIEEKATPNEKEKLRQYRDNSSKFNERERTALAVNCWHMNEYESAAMWKLYVKSDEGIAIQSTYSRLLNSFYDSDGYMLFVGTVKYIDYNKEVIPVDNMFYPYIHKRRSFEYERELRAIITPSMITTNPSGKKGKAITLGRLPKEGVHIPINIPSLVEMVYVSPTCEIWFEDLVRSVLKTYQIEKIVKRSSLADDPIF